MSSDGASPKAYMKCATKYAANIGATLILVASARPKKSPASTESIVRPRRATLTRKNTVTVENSARNVSTAKKWLSWMWSTASATSAAASSPERLDHIEAPSR